MANDQTRIVELPLNGKLITGVDGSQLSLADFKTLKNMRYTATGIKGIMGQTKYNTATALGDANGRVVVSGIHFDKDLPAESHVLTQVMRTDETDSAIYDNTTAIGSQGDFSSLKTGTGAYRGVFSTAPDSSLAWCNGTYNYIWGGAEFRCASFISYDGITAAPSYVYDQTEQINNTINDASNCAVLKRISSSGHNYTYIYIGATRPISGIKFYIRTANTAAATAAVNYWNGSAWAAVSSLSDGTSAGGKTMAQTGSMSFTSTATTAKVKMIYGSMAYFYQVILTDVDDSIAVYYCTVASAMENITDLWDGVYRSLASCKTEKTDINDVTLDVSAEDYVNGADKTYLDIKDFTSTNYVYVGSLERLCGIKVTMVKDYENTNSSNLTISYWNGAAWASAAALSDATAIGGKTLNTSGLITWSPIAENTEFKTAVGDDTRFYYYRLSFSATLDGSVRIDAIMGIPTPKVINNYQFPVMWQNRLCLLDNTTGDRNSLLISSYGSSCVFNGTDTTELFLGDNTRLTAGTAFFSRISGDFYESFVVTKVNETWIIDGTTPEDFKQYRLSKIYGCVAPATMVSCGVGSSVVPGMYKHVVIWQAATCIIMMDGTSVVPISDDIKDLFDRNSSVYVATATADDSYSFFDQKENEYHWLFIDSAGARREFVYALTQRKWFEIDRTSTKRLVCGFPAVDTVGNHYTYGGDAAGYVYRLEYGTDFDGQDIVQNFVKPDFWPLGTTSADSEITDIQLVAKAKNTDSPSVTITHYGDTSSTGTALTVGSLADSTHRITRIKRRLHPNSHFVHSFDVSVTTDEETYGFEPLFLTAWARPTHAAKGI